MNTTKKVVLDSNFRFAHIYIPSEESMLLNYITAYSY
jgi:hypothetical protein